MIQDYIISACLCSLVVGLIPSVFGPNKPSKWTCLTMVVSLSIINICLATLRLWFSMGVQTLGVICWVMMLVQQYKREGKIKRFLNLVKQMEGKCLKHGKLKSVLLV